MTAETYGRPPELPADAKDLVVRGPGDFVTAVDYRRSDGTVVHWEARAARKARSPGTRTRGMTWWTGRVVRHRVGVLRRRAGPRLRGGRRGRARRGHLLRRLALLH